MPEITITDDQQRQIEKIRADLEEAFIDSYGHVRIKDVIEYLLDTYTPPNSEDEKGSYERIATAEYPALQRVAGEVPEVPGSGIDADKMRGKLLSILGPEEFAAKLEATDSDRTDDSQADSPEETASEDETETTDPFDSVNKLLRDHDDRWHESDGDIPYEVELPDGTTEPARTKDDVRQLLFRHY